MIKKLFIAPILLVIAAGFAAPQVSAQVRPRMNRIGKAQRLESAGDPQVGQRRFPPGGVNRPPLNMPQGNRQPGANQARFERTGNTWKTATAQFMCPADKDRPFSIYLVNYGAGPLGALGAGVLAQVAGLRAPFLAGAGIALVMVVVTARYLTPASTLVSQST